MAKHIMHSILLPSITKLLFVPSKVSHKNSQFASVYFVLKKKADIKKKKRVKRSILLQN